MKAKYSLIYSFILINYAILSKKHFLFYKCDCLLLKIFWDTIINLFLFSHYNQYNFSTLPTTTPTKLALQSNPLLLR